MHVSIKIKPTSFLLLIMALSAMGLVSCQDPPKQAVEPKPAVVSVKISQPQALPKVIDRPAVPKVEPVSVPDPVLKSEPAPGKEPPVLLPSQQEVYSPEGRVDPFRPLIQTRAKTAVAVDVEDKKPSRPLTPLEKFDLSQIRLVAVVLAESEKMAMVEEASGKGYVVKIGSYIGKDGGEVEQILEDRIVIREMVKNFKGEAVSRTREMKLHKQEIEG